MLRCHCHRAFSHWIESLSVNKTLGLSSLGSDDLLFSHEETPVHLSDHIVVRRKEFSSLDLPHSNKNEKSIDHHSMMMIVLGRWIPKEQYILEYVDLFVVTVVLCFDFR